MIDIDRPALKQACDNFVARAQTITVKASSLRENDTFFFNGCNNKIDSFRTLTDPVHKGMIRFYCGRSWMTFDPNRDLLKVVRG